MTAENGKITIAEMAEEMGLSKTTINEVISALKQEGRLARIGGNKSGYWQALQEGESPDAYDPYKERTKRLLELIAENGKITIAEMAEEMGLSKNAINKMIAVLKQEGRLARIGGNKSGYWQALQKGESPDSYDPYKERKKRLLELTAENKRITIAEMAEEMSLSKNTIDKMIAVLKQEGRLARIGSDKSGYWQILREGESPDAYDPHKDRGEKILALAAKNKTITTAEMAEEMSLSKSTIKREISALKQEGRLARIGVNPNGYWAILEN